MDDATYAWIGRASVLAFRAFDRGDNVRGSRLALAIDRVYTYYTD